MESAIVTGASGYIGSSVVRELISHDIRVLAIGRRPRTQLSAESIPDSPLLSYAQIDLSSADNLLKVLKNLDWSPSSSCIFYHFAWSGNNSLVDGTPLEQYRNVHLSSNLVAIAKSLGCKKFISAGSVEETLLEHYLSSDWPSTFYQSPLALYALAKLASRDMCKIAAYLNKIDYIHTRFSSFIDLDLSSRGYIHDNFRRILDQRSYESPINTGPFDLVPLRWASSVYRLIGLHGKNQFDYYIGSGHPQTLTDYLQYFLDLINGTTNPSLDKETLKFNPLITACFSNDSLASLPDLPRVQTFAEYASELFANHTV